MKIRYILPLFFFAFIIPCPASAQEDIFRVKTPNVMIIFDTSSSMNMKPDGTPVGSGNVCVDSFGRIQPTNGGLPYGTPLRCDKGYTYYHFEGGANHPFSKLYQAKLALKEVIEDVVKDRVNLGFATYAQFKTEKRRGYYQRQRRNYTAPVSEYWYWRKLYWRFNRYGHSNSVHSFSSNSFTDEWGTTHTGVTVGYYFYRTHTFHNSPFNNSTTVPPMNPLGQTPGTYVANLKYTVTSITYNAEYNRYTYTYVSDAHDHYEETWRSLNFSNNNPIDCNAHFTKTWGAWQTFDSSDSDQIANPAKWACQGPIHVPGVAESWGNWYTEYAWLEFNGTSCPPESGSDNYPPNGNQWTRWTLVPPGTCYDWSTYYYPADGSDNKPHTWSYFKMVGGNWPEGIQTPNYFPSKDSGGNLNNDPGTFNNRYFFVNFPDDKDSNFSPSIRTANRNLIMSFLDLTPVQSPETLRWWTKLPVHAYAGRSGLTSNTTESLFTPLADSLKYAHKYFYDYIYNYNGGDTASQQSARGVLCRGNYIILLTDGLESARLSGGLPDYTAAPTEAGNLKTINVKTFVIGFGTDLQGNITLNNIAASGGTNQAYFATDLPSLKRALESIFQAILDATYGRSNPVITKSRDRVFKGFFEFTADGSWKGGLYAYEIDKASGQLIDQNPSTPEVIDPAWDGGEKVTNQSSRSVWTWKDDVINPDRVEFGINTGSIYPSVYPAPRTEDINMDGRIDDDDAKTIIGYTLDPNYYDGKNPAGFHKGQRPIVGGKGWKLGDIYHSTPVIIGAPPFGLTENDYRTFYQRYKNRTQIVYVGANDGMLHGFKNIKRNPPDPEDGREHVAIVPKSLLGKVKNLRSSHDYYVDGTPKAYDVFFNNLSTSETWQKWRTILITGLRDGGPYYFAVDVTNPDGYSYGPEYPRILWEWTDTETDSNNMGNSWAKPDIGKIRDGGTVKYVAFITGGYAAGNNVGNSFYIVDIETGTTLKKWKKLGSSDNKIPSGPVAFDANGDGLVDYVYFGDIEGTLWRVDVRDTNKENWTCNPLYTPPSSQRKPIFYSPAVVKNNEGKILVFFGTGDELNLLTVTDNYFWEVWDDNGTGKIITMRVLDENGNEKFITKWPILLPKQKVLSSPVVANNVVYFTTWEYTGAITDNYCGAGSGRLYGLKISNRGVLGGVAGLVLLDSNNNPLPAVEFTPLGPGIPTSPVVTNGTIYVSSNVNAKDVLAIKFLGWPTTRTRSWREVF